jgi:hypothetical protein
VPVVRLAVAACVLLVLAACGTKPAADETRQSLHEPTLSAAAERSDSLATGGITRSLGDDITISVSAPTSFKPTPEAYPKAARAVAFELVLHNRGDIIYRPAQLSFVATADGLTADPLVDSTQGYTGVIGATDQVLPSQSLRFAVAFSVPDRPCVVRVAVRPQATSGNAIPIFDGTA